MSTPRPPPVSTTAPHGPRAQSAPPRRGLRDSPGSPKKDKKDVPAWAQSPFSKQITRNQALIGKLLEDNTLVRVLRGANATVDAYDANYHSQSHYPNTMGHVRHFGNVVGRIELHKAGTRAAAAGTRPSNWFPTAPPKDNLTRPSSASSGVSFEKQITRKQDVNGKLLEDNTMSLFLFGRAGKGPEYYDKAYDSLTKPVKVSHRPRPGSGHHNFNKQVGRLPFGRDGSRSAADGHAASFWEPGMSYRPEGKNNGKAPSFEKNNGRGPLHLSGMRGAPPPPREAATYSGETRPQSAIAILRSVAENGPSSFGSKRQARARADRPISEPARHIYTLSWDKSQTREQWTAQPLRIER
ncbi:hypothetical protein AB1Y20_007223 [Prymnesium parvum]|uniref:Uncharacterized protein n=1 Tax=Prymnesium parvum TaxID=97485 RepID=A0AB34IWW6_PRYPA